MPGLPPLLHSPNVAALQPVRAGGLPQRDAVCTWQGGPAAAALVSPGWTSEEPSLDKRAITEGVIDPFDPFNKKNASLRSG